MAKVQRGRLSGISGMSSQSGSNLNCWASQIENQIQEPLNSNDQRWLRRTADKLRQLADQKEKAKVHKDEQKKLPSESQTSRSNRSR